jgi:hypothetical protein
MLTEKPEHMTDEEWSAFNDDEMGEAPKAKYQDAIVDDIPSIKQTDDDAEVFVNADDNKPVEQQVVEIDVATIEVPEITGAEAKLEAATTEYQAAKDSLKELMQQYEDGELDQAEYNIESRELERKIDRLSGKIETLEEQSAIEQQKLEQYQAQAEAAWAQAQNKFFEQPENKKFLEKKGMVNALNTFVVDLLGENPTPDKYGELLAKARELYVDEFGEFYQGAKSPESTKMQTPKPQPRKIEPPKTLAHIPVAEPNNMAEGRFAPLDSIRDPEQLEKAIARMSSSDRDLYLRGAA